MGRHALRARIESERFDLVPLNVWQTFRLTYPWTRDAEFIASFSGSGAPRSPRKWYREMIRPNNKTRFVHGIVPRGESAPIGVHSMSIYGYRSCRLGIGIQDRSWWGKGVVQEVRTRLIDHVFEHSDVERLHAQVVGRNLPSVFNYQKLGFAHVGTMHRSKFDPVTGQVHDMLIFEIFRDEWMKRKAERRG
ncbi:MAG: GNAT family N-acetyltransferase [Mesorhizobium sp.]|nr:GNAT family protein [Mesorhizobium sp.]MBL8578057.1 GNAT family N-acetyltransferase [Mesorhizobium sp.]